MTPAADLSLFPRTHAALNEGIVRSLHLGGQICVHHRGATVLNAAFGTADQARKMTTDHRMLWRSAGKPVTAAAVCLAVWDSLIDLDAPIGEFLQRPTRLETTTLRQILSHQSGLPVIDPGWPQRPWHEILAHIHSTPPGDRVAAYQPQATWFLLAEILEHTDPQDRTWSQIVEERVLRPAGMNSAECGLPADTPEEVLPRFYERQRGELMATQFHEPPWLTAGSPGGNFRGPIAELVAFYHWLSTTEDGHLAAAMSSPQREGLVDHTFQHVIDVGLGVILNSQKHGPETVPYGYGQHASPATIGHGGAQCAMGFCDPQKQVIAAWAVNGFCGEGMHQRRNRAINEAIYDDLANR